MIITLLVLGKDTHNHDEGYTCGQYPDTDALHLQDLGFSLEFCSSACQSVCPFHYVACS